MSVPTFVVGTGRCGSTMLSNMLRDHPGTLSLSEFWQVTAGKRSSEAFSREPMDGRRFWAIVAAITPWYSFAFRHGVVFPELLYPYDAPAARYSRQTGVPSILLTTLPHLTDDHDHLFDMLRDEVNKWPMATIGEHYKHLFGWLAEHFNKRLWVERSGGSSLMTIEQILATFPDARFVHVVRDGRDAAISMREHQAYRLGFVLGSLEQFLGVDPLESADRTHIDRVPAELRPFLPEQFDADAFRAFRAPLSLGAEFWAQSIDNALKVLRALPADRLLTLRYEDFFVDPKKQLDTLTAFLGEEFVDEDWSARCAATVRKPRSSWRDLPDETARALTQACRPGFENSALQACITMCNQPSAGARTQLSMRQTRALRADRFGQIYSASHLQNWFALRSRKINLSLLFSSQAV